MSGHTLFKWAILLAAGLLGCDPNHPSPGPQGADSQTNWLKSCQIDAECNGLSCVCGVCTQTCSSDAACGETTRGASCISASDPGAITQCGGARPEAPGLCLPRCDDEHPCDTGKICVTNLCSPIPNPSVKVSVDISRPHQVLVGFGASLAYAETQITSHPKRDQLLDAVFKELGLDVLRVRNRYVDSPRADSPDVANTAELVTAATARLGHAPGLFLTSWTPPATLKGNSALKCNGAPNTCTLAKNAQGDFDYAGFGQYWRSSLDAYAKVGVKPDYIGLQNNPNWVPNATEVFEACKFLPVEGSATVSLNGRDTVVDYPGLAEAQSAVLEALAGLSTRPKLLAPETSGSGNVADYVANLDLTEVAAFAHHLYGTDPSGTDPGGLAGLDALPSERQRPVFITEMEADGFDTALTVHHATVDQGAAVYLQNALLSPPSGPTANPRAVFGVDDTSFVAQDPYHALRHFARFTEPGWARVDATSTVTDLLASAWISPSKDALTVILINSGSTELNIELDLPALLGTTSEISRSAFSGVERSVSLGSFTAERVLQLPARGVMTVALLPP